MDNGDLGVLGAAGLNTEPHSPSEEGQTSSTLSTYNHRNLLLSWVSDWQDPISRPRGFNPNHLARPWASQTRGNILGQRLDDLSDFLVLGDWEILTGIGWHWHTKRDVALVALPPCSIKAPAVAARQGSQSPAGTDFLVPHPVGVEITTVVRAAERHDLQSCRCFRSSSPSPNQTMQTWGQSCKRKISLNASNQVTRYVLCRVRSASM